MIYQIDGKIVKEKPEGSFEKVVTVFGKLENYITKITENKTIIETHFKHKGEWLHVVKTPNDVQINGESVFRKGE